MSENLLNIAGAAPGLGGLMIFCNPFCRSLHLTDDTITALVVITRTRENHFHSTNSFPAEVSLALRIPQITDPKNLVHCNEKCKTAKIGNSYL